MYQCLDYFEGGGWALVRRVKQGATWHPATDNLAGTQAHYGTYGSDTSDATFGVVYSSFVTSSTEFLFATGINEQNYASVSSCDMRWCILGDKSKWLMTTWAAINNYGVAYSATFRDVTRSSYSANPCTLSALLPVDFLSQFLN